MRYMGSKRRIAGNIVPILTKARGDRPFVEPFCGGANLTIYMDGERYCNDLNKYVVACLKAVSEGWTPPLEVSEELYNKIKKEVKEGIENYPPEVIGFVGICCSFGANWFCSYARGKSRNYALTGVRNLENQRSYLRNITWSSVDYREMKFPDNSFIYCDPPYKDTTNYGKIKFNHDEFYDWCRAKKAEGHIVYISEFEAPFEVVWELNWNCGSGISSQRKHNYKSIRTERLFRV